ncbi:MAG: uroporphyrinogen-III synthase [Zoogloeaceae bacterium]|jgi:uroporphyrinogen-III synthase|nr:uroporphyrinogen-III synthase [Zoogloeaceae bacterium]
MAVDRPLDGRNIVVTRPAGQVAHLAERLIELGAKPVLFPVLAIYDVDDPAPLQDVAIRLDQFDWACFVSPNAIEKSLPTLLASRTWPPGLRTATVGKSSEQALARFGVGKVVAPQDRFDSEALLELPELQAMQGKRVVIFRGDGGRELLGDTLRQRGAEVEYIACYRRDKPALDPAPLLKLWSDSRLDGVTVTSSEGLRNFVEMIGKLGQTWLKKTPLFVPHQRIAALARALGCHDVILTGAGDDGLITGLLEYYHDHAA